MAADITGVFPGATQNTSEVNIPISTIVSYSGIPAASGDLDLCFGLVSSIANYITSLSPSQAAASQSQRAVDTGTLRMDYTFRFDLAYDVENLNMQ